MSPILPLILFIVLSNSLPNSPGIMIKDGLELTNDDLGAKSRDFTMCLDEINNLRRQNGKSSLDGDSRLQNAASDHISYMIRHDCFAHQCPGEPSPEERVSNAGYNWRTLGQTILAGPHLGINCNTGIGIWMDSSNRDILLGDYRHLGCFLAAAAFSPLSFYWTCIFTTPA